MGDEKLIEEAAKAIYETSADAAGRLKFEDADEWNREIARGDARSALAAFRRVLAPAGRENDRTTMEEDARYIKHLESEIVALSGDREPRRESSGAQTLVASHERLCGCVLDDCEFKKGWRAAVRAVSKWGGA